MLGQLLRSRAAIAVAGVVTLAGMVVASLAIPMSAASAGPHLAPAVAWSAPAGSDGAIRLAEATCAGAQKGLRLRARTSVIDTTSGAVLVRLHYVGRPADQVARVPVGDYRVTTVARCGKARGRLVQTVDVARQTPARTITRAEFDRIAPGMDREQVAAIVGYDGVRDAPTQEAGTQIRRYDEPELMHAATVSFRDGAVVGKAYDAVR